ncbi:MAG: PaaI family thioesterase [Jatrophihabitantaceae bacterium]
MDERKLRDLGRERAVRADSAGLWRTLGYRLVSWDRGSSVVAWRATEDYGFATDAGYVVQGGLVSAVLDAAMGGACWTVLDAEQVFLTADLRVEFLRSAQVGELVATGTVVRSTRRVVFCAGELHDADGVLLAAGRCTQVLLPIEHRSRRSHTARTAVAPEDR